MLIPKVEQRIIQMLRFLKPLRYRELAALDFEIFETEKTFRSPPEGGAWEKIPSPGAYGKPWHCAWFRASFRAPAGGAYPLYLRVVPNADSLAFVDGKPAGAFNPFHKKIKVSADGKDHTLHVESYAGHPYPGCHPFEGRSVVVTIAKVISGHPNVFEGGALVERIEPVYSLYYDIKCLFELAKTLDNNSLRKARILQGLYNAIGAVHFASTGKVLEEEAETAAAGIAPLLAVKNSPTVPEIHLIGHAHIDHAWLWHIGETERKAARTFMNMARMSEEYPDFVFIQTQPCQLEIIRNEYPEVFAAVKAAFKRGNWEPNGGMWVEADCNISGGESLVRQFLVGKAANRELLGADSDTLWLPDVFGYAAALPQILAGCGIKYFVTSKINWNDTTRFPYDTFVWRGIDGTGIKTHYIASRTEGYNGKVNPGSLAEIWNEIQHKELQAGGVIKSVGEGDGGGGTTRGDLEMARRLGDLEGAPKAGWRSVSSALERIFAGSEEWPEWRGELYLELHRGTYTTQARTKRYNRRLEFALRAAELLAVSDTLETGAAYPRAELLADWKLLLTNQFHDIIPGSSIRRVYAEAEETYRKIESSLEGIAGAARQKTAKKLAVQYGGGVTVFNSLSWERRDPAAIRGAAAGAGIQALRSSTSGEVYPAQRYRDMGGGEALVFTPTLPSLGWAHFVPAPAVPENSVSAFVYNGRELKTPFYDAAFDEAGRITSLKDRASNREMVAPGGVFNGLVSAQDVPVLWEAWDIDSDWTRYLEREERLLSTELVSEGPLFLRLRRKYRISAASELTQDTVFYAKDRRIDFETKVDWREQRRVLKAEFNTALDAATVRCEVQYGHLLRNTHRNLPHDRAKFEICAHKWICLEEGREGIALLNDCKYGHDVLGGSMRLTLLRAPTVPDEEADQGEQRFTYSLLPFAEGFAVSRVIQTGYELNDSAVAEFTPGAAGTGKVSEGAAYSLFSIDGDAVIAECVKAPEAEAVKNGLVIRLYESQGARTRTTLRFRKPIVSAAETDMLEAEGRTIPVKGTDLELDFRSFEIKTLLVRF